MVSSFLGFSTASLTTLKTGMGKRAVPRGMLIVGAVLVISHVFSASYLVALIIVGVMGIFGEIIHMPENLPGEADNPEGKELHPAKAIFLGGAVVLVLIILGEVFPELYEYGGGRHG